MSIRNLLLASAIAVGAFAALSGGANAAALYALTKTVTLGPPDRWDLLTFVPASRRVYIAHGDRVTVVDGQSGAIIGNVTGFPGGTHGVAILPGQNRGYSDDGRAGTAGAFDLKTLKLTDKVNADKDADAIAFDPVSGHVFVIDGDPGKVTVIDPKTDKIVTTIDGGGKLETGIADGAGNLYVNGEANGEIVHIDTRTDSVVDHWPLAGCTSPHGIAIDTQDRRLFSSCANGVLLAMNADNGKVVASLPIGTGSDGAAFDPVRKRVFSSNGEGTVTVIGEMAPDSYKELGTLQTVPSARTMTIDPQTGRLYLVAAEIKINQAAAPNDFRNRFRLTPGSTRLLIYDPES
jgi:DNA-binding beta-propeller fold protein YncE